MKLDSSGALIFSTCLRGSIAVQASAIAVDASGNAYITGSADNTFQTTSGAFQPLNQGGKDAFVAKFTSTGSEVYATFLGGTGSDAGYGVAADANGSAYVTGSTSSAAFSGAPSRGAQPTNSGGGDAFIAKLNPSGTALAYFTFFGGTAVDQGNAITVDVAGNAYIAGYTASAGLATTGAAQTVHAGGYDGFIAKLNPAGTAFYYVTYLGGNRQDQINGLAIDGSGNVYVAGQTDSANFPIQSAAEPVIPGGGTTLFQTLNSGASWSAFDANILGAVFDLTADPIASGTIVVATEQGIFRTTNNGVSWTQQFAGFFYSISLSRSPANPATIYAALVGLEGGPTPIYRSSDGGLTWSLPGQAPQAPFATTSVVADPANADTVWAFSYAGGVYESIDAGKSWSYPARFGIGQNIFVNSMVVAAANDVPYFDTTSGIYPSLGGELPRGVGFNSSQQPLSASATNPPILYVAAGGLGVYKDGDGSSLRPITLTPWYPGQSDIQLVAVSPLNSSLVYAWGTFPYVSTDGGTTWSNSGAGLVNAFVSEFAFDPLNSARAFAIATPSTAGFAAKLNTSGTAFVWSTYLGDAGNYTQAFGVATDGVSRTFVTGRTVSHAVRPIPSAPAFDLPNYSDAFVTKIADATPSCTYSLSPSAQVVTGVEKITLYSVTAPSGCAWSASSNQSWATIPAGAAGTGTGTVYVRTATNSTGAISPPT